MEDTAAAAPYEGELSDTGRGGCKRRWTALYARAEVEFVDFDRICERPAVSRKEAGACDDAHVVRVRVLRACLVAIVQLRRRLVILHRTCAQEEKSKIQISGIEIVYSNRNFWSPHSAISPVLVIR